MKNVSRRNFLMAAAVTTAGATLAACAPQATPTPQVVEVEVTKRLSPSSSRIICMWAWAFNACIATPVRSSRPLPGCPPVQNAGRATDS